jgi:hypothetical protein
MTKFPVLKRATTRLRTSTDSVDTEEERRERGLGYFMRLTPIIALLAIVCYAAGEEQTASEFFSILGVGATVGAAAFFAGVLLGFLFGLPKTIDKSATSKARLATNTNLDQISDWLTKILVGIGLVQIGKLTHGVSNLGASIAPGLGGESGAKAFAVALLAYSSLDGFLVGYIWTRTDLSRLFRLAAEDLDPIEEALSQPLRQVPPAA